MWGIVKKLSASTRLRVSRDQRFGFQGYGFISPGDGGGKDLFFHENSLVGVTFNELDAGDVLGFDTEDAPHGPIAVNIQRNGGRHRFDRELQVVNTFATPAPALVESAPIASVRTFTKDLMRYLRRNPKELYQLHSGVFEELVAEIFKSEGYHTEIIGRFNQADGGVDIVAVRREIGGMTFRCAIQCKRYAADNSISAEPLRSLRGSMDRYQAPYGVLATTSFFTQPARDEVQAYLWMIGLRDYDNIVTALNRLELH